MDTDSYKEHKKTLPDILNKCKEESKVFSKIVTHDIKLNKVSLEESMRHAAISKDINLCEKIYWDYKSDKEKQEYMEKRHDYYPENQEIEILKSILEFESNVNVSLNPTEFYYSKYDYFTCGMPLLHDFISGNLDKNQFEFNLYWSNLNRHTYLGEIKHYRVGSNVVKIVNIGGDKIKKYKNELVELGADILKDPICQYWLRGKRNSKLFKEGNFLKIHKKIVRDLFESRLDKRLAIVLLSVLRFAQSYKKTEVFIHTQLLPIRFTKSVFKKNLDILVTMGYIDTVRYSDDKIYVDVKKDYIVY